MLKKVTNISGQNCIWKIWWKHLAVEEVSPSDGIKKKKKSSLRLLRDIILDVSFCLISTESPGLFVAHVPVILNGNREMPYRTLTLRGELLAPSLTFDPDSIRLMPVPLSTKVSVNFNITEGIVHTGLLFNLFSFPTVIASFLLFLLLTVTIFQLRGLPVYKFACRQVLLKVIKIIFIFVP